MRKLIILGLSALLAACGGGGSSTASTSTPTTAVGYFKDSNTQGLRYVSGGQSGVTGADGSFTYEVGKPVTFSVGGVTLGTVAAGQSVVTPVEVAAATTSSQTVQNLTRFLMMLDSDGNPANGIQISTAVQTAAANWPAVNFNQTEANFTTAVNTIVTAASTADSSTHALPTAATAQTHVEGTLRCARSGGFKGRYSGSDSGPVGVMVDATRGMVSGYFNSSITPSTTPGTISGTTATGLDQTGAFTSGSTSTGAAFTGGYSSPDTVSGTWTNTTLGAASGTLSLSRIGGLLNATHRFTGKFSGSGYGLFTFDVNASNVVSGVAYDVTADSLVTVSGTLSGTTLTGTSSSGANITGTLNTSTGALSGTWTNPTYSASGTFTGGGCKLN